MNMMKKMLILLLVAVFVVVPMTSCAAQLKLPKEEILPELVQKTYGQKLRESVEIDPMFPESPADDEEYNILLVGNSYSTHWPDELAFLFQAAGYESVQICNIYHSGASFEDHWSWFQNGDRVETFHINRPGQKDGRTSWEDVGWEECVTYANWDAISFQQTNRYVGATGKYRVSISQWLPQIFTYLYGYFPEATYFWQQNWSHSAGKDSYASPKSTEDNLKWYREQALFICAEWDFINVPLGQAWTDIRYDPLFYSHSGDYENDLPTKSLHTRVYDSSSKKGTVTNADLSHDGNIGGGQYLNACVWFEMLTHESVLNISTAPVYTDIDGNVYAFTDEQIKKLQNAAHSAVLADYGEEWYTK